MTAVCPPHTSSIIIQTAAGEEVIILFMSSVSCLAMSALYSHNFLFILWSGEATSVTELVHGLNCL